MNQNENNYFKYIMHMENNILSIHICIGQLNSQGVKEIFLVNHIVYLGQVYYDK